MGRFNLNLSVDSRYNLLPINYQYEISSWIYKTIHCGNSDFSQWLHQQGYQLENKRYKLFTFSNIFIHPPWKIKGDRIEIFSDEANIQLSFYISEAMGNFIVGLFQQEHIRIGDRKSQARFEIRGIEKIADPPFLPKMQFRCLSPMCLSRAVAAKKTAEYLAPSDERYSSSFFDSLIYKYMAATSAGQTLNELKEQMNEEQPMALRVIGKTRSRLVKIKTDTPEQTFVRGYMYSFEISAPKYLIEFGFHTGFGEKNTMGFGCVEKF